MDTVERDVTQFLAASDLNSPGTVEAVKHIVQAVNQASVQSNLLQLIQSMGEHLTSHDEFIRAKAMWLLSHTLQQCHRENIVNTAVSVLAEFYCDRLTDRYCVQSLLEGLLALTKFENFYGNDAIVVATRLFERVDAHQLSQPARNVMIQVLQQLLDRHATSLHAINNAFVYGFTQVMDGEKDPRNLMQAFQLVKSIIDQLDVSAHTEDLFEVIFCYFPITFKPPPDDPYGITADDLKKSLRMCLSATPLFGKLGTPLIVEKLTTATGSAKKDAIETIAACAPVYGSMVIQPVAAVVLNALKAEIYHVTDAASEESALEAIERVVATLDSSRGGLSTDAFLAALNPLVSECIAHVTDQDLKNATPAGRILRAIASASATACQSIAEAMLPLLFRQYRETEVTTRRKATMDAILRLLEASKALQGSVNGDINMDHDLTSPLASYKDRLFALFEPVVTSPNESHDLRLTALKGLEIMVTTREYLSQNELSVAIQSFDKILRTETNDELRSASTQVLKVVAEYDATWVLAHTIPGLIALLPNAPHEQTPIGYRQTLATLQTLCPSPSTFDTSLQLLLRKLQTVCGQDHDSAYPHAILVALLDNLQTKIAQKHTDIGACIETLVPFLISQTVCASLHNGSLFLSPNVLKVSARITVTVMETLDTTTQKAFMEHVWRLYSDNAKEAWGIVAIEPFIPFQAVATEAQKATTSLFAAVITSCRKEVTFPVSSTEEFLNSLVGLSLATNNGIQEISLARIVGSIINKWRQNTAVNTYVTTCSVQLESIILGEEPIQRRKALDIYLWITKGLVLRSHSLGYELSNKVIQWCASPAIGKQASQGLDVVIGDDALALHKSSFATVTLLYKQRFFHHCLPLLLQAIQTSDHPVKHNYLAALSHVLKHMPKQIVLNELPQLVPFLIQSLALPDKSLKEATLDTLCLALTDTPRVLEPHADALFPALFELLEPSPDNSVTVRIATLNCLGRFPSGFSNDVLLFHAGHVIKQLIRPLDDKKRLVRRAAVDCRAKWYPIVA